MNCYFFTVSFPLSLKLNVSCHLMCFTIVLHRIRYYIRCLMLKGDIFCYLRKQDRVDVKNDCYSGQMLIPISRLNIATAQNKIFYCLYICWGYHFSLIS